VPHQYGFSAGTGYDQVTGLGSVDADKLAAAWAATVTPSFTSTASPVSYQILPGSSVDATVNVTFASGFSGTVDFTCTGVSSTVQLTCTPPPAISASGQVTAHVTSTSATPLGTYVLLLTGTSGSKTASTRAAVAVTQPLTLTPTAASFQVTQGAAIDATVNVAFGNGFSGTVTFTCAEPSTLLATTCTPPPQINAAGSVSFHFQTTAPTAALQPSDPGTRIFYAALLPGLLGIVVMAGSRPARRGMRLLGFIIVLGFSTLWLGSCGGTASKSNSSNTGTPVGTYTVTVTGTSGATSSSATFQLVVQ
jgi:hypothetical protein